MCFLLLPTRQGGTETNAFETGLVEVAGNLPIEGYREEFEKAKFNLDWLECENAGVVPEKHESRYLGYCYLRAA